MQGEDREQPGGRVLHSNITAKLKSYRPSHTVFEAEVAAPRCGEGADGSACLPSTGSLCASSDQLSSMLTLLNLIQTPNPLLLAAQLW